jgi:hypothetical protein
MSQTGEMGPIRPLNLPDWNKLQELYDLARERGIGFTMVYQEASDEFYFAVNSNAKGERYVGPNYSFEGALDSIKEFLKSSRFYTAG